RVGTHASNVALAVNLEAIVGRQGFNGAINAKQEIVAVRLDVKANQVGAEQAVDQLTLPRADGEHFGIGPGNVPEDGHTRVGPGFFHHAGKQREVIILRENDWRLHAFHLFQQGIREAAVNLLIAEPVFGTKNWSRVGDVAKRPETFVSETFIVV